MSRGSGVVTVAVAALRAGFVLRVGVVLWRGIGILLTMRAICVWPLVARIVETVVAWVRFGLVVGRAVCAGFIRAWKLVTAVAVRWWSLIRSEGVSLIVAWTPLARPPIA